MGSRAPLHAAAAAAFSVTTLGLSGAAWSQVTVSVGGLTQSCSVAAKTGRATPQTIQPCTDALYTEPLDQHDLYGAYDVRGAYFDLK